jgi:hypothetical protein
MKYNEFVVPIQRSVIKKDNEMETTRLDKIDINPVLLTT